MTKLESASMEPLSKCLLLPIDGSEEALLPIRFISRLFPRLDRVGLILCYFIPPLPPIYDQRPVSVQMSARRTELVRKRKQDAHEALEHAKQVLLRYGFPAEEIQEHLQEKAMNAAHHACQLADLKKVDAVLVQKRISSPLEGFLQDDPSNALLRHCIVSPIWFVEGEVEPAKAAICLQTEAASLRAVDHAAFMLAETATTIDLVHVTQSVTRSMTSPAFAHSAELAQWLKTAPGMELRPFLTDACDILKNAGITASRTRITLLPGSEKEGKVAEKILSHAKQHAVGIVVLGHSNPEGTWSFLKASVTKKIIAEFQNMAVWVNQ